jgi:hypothetical protein
MLILRRLFRQWNRRPQSKKYLKDLRGLFRQWNRKPQSKKYTIDSKGALPPVEQKTIF